MALMFPVQKARRASTEGRSSLPFGLPVRGFLSSASETKLPDV